MSLSFYSFFLEDLLISGKPLLTSGNGFNVDFVNKELPPLPATDSVRNNNMSDRHSQRAYEQTCFYCSNVCSPTKTRRNTDHIRSFQRHINQRQYRTERCNPQIRPSRQPRSIAQTINADDYGGSNDGDERYIDERVSKVVVSEMRRDGC